MFDDDRAAGRVRTRADYLTRFPGFEDRIAREFDELDARRRDAAAERRTHDRALPVVARTRPWRPGRRLARARPCTRPADRALEGADERGGWLSSARRERLQREVAALARLDHPGICPIYEAELSGPTPFLAMRPRVAGESPRRACRRGAGFSTASNRLLAALPDWPLRWPPCSN